MVTMASTLLDDDLSHVRTGLMQDEVIQRYVGKLNLVWAPNSYPGDDLPENDINGQPISIDLYEKKPVIVSGEAAYTSYDLRNLGVRHLEMKIRQMAGDLMEYIRKEHAEDLVNINSMKIYHLPPVDDFQGYHKLKVCVWIYKKIGSVVVIDEFKEFEW